MYIFNLINSTNPLDATFIHPNFHSLAFILCKASYHKLLVDKNEKIFNFEKYDINKDQDKIAEMFINNPNLFHSTSLEIDANDSEDMNSLSNIRAIFLRNKEIYFSGATDLQIFNDVVPHLEIDNVYTGSIFKSGSDFYLAHVNNAVVYIKKNFECALNQLVQVKILGKTPFLLSYNGEIIENQACNVYRYRSHILFRNLSDSNIQQYMDANSYSVLIRPSSTESHCVVVCKIQNNLFYSFKVREFINVDEHSKIYYEFEQVKYNSIDSFISEYIQKMYQRIEEIISFKYFFQTVREAEANSRSSGEYVRYSVCFSYQYPRYLEFIVAGKKIFIKIDGGDLILKNMKFKDFSHLVGYVKLNHKSLL